MDSQKADSRTEDSMRHIAEAKARGRRLVFTNGCFDLLHIGHTRYLESARALGDLLVVGLNSDASVRRLKGDSRPVVPEHERREVLLALRSVDEVILFDEDTPYDLIAKVSPDILVKGGDWTVEKIVGADLVLQRGGKVLSLPYVVGSSTTNIIERIEARARDAQPK